ncbi:ankyrin repeat domain-containing protein [Myxococcaceae bacterium GXIMD 01537]
MSLFDAVLAGDAPRVEDLLAAGEDANAFGERGRTPLMVAAEAGHEPVVRLLLDAGAEPSFTDAAGESALVMAAAHGHAEVCALLLPHARDDERDLARQLLAGYGHLGELPPGPLEPARAPTRGEGLRHKLASAGAYVAGKLGDDGPTQRLQRALRSQKERGKP